MAYLYPVIIGCIGEARAPSPDEIRRVAKRVQREIYPGQVIDAPLRRHIVRIALAALR
ncbi:hypothetical protein [Novosphingobium album (ex Liu et al. 2023)]|uniref:Uncharacterized protein n=1 Tax=Novosphingobium album (ex Liu et al. 2023) TaxID=3031130 RepID=A0ABT5WY85_9SPHN|nr:hypothetical protein [Novosphingobium album (ex Liu et al. 2023)]MDE8654698.1 hypothetical protein [Novosphingobium album (ex Liu et al. 2023)]